MYMCTAGVVIVLFWGGISNPGDRKPEPRCACMPGNVPVVMGICRVVCGWPGVDDTEAWNELHKISMKAWCHVCHVARNMAQQFMSKVNGCHCHIRVYTGGCHTCGDTGT